MCGVMMGDANAVTAVLHANRKMLLEANVKPEELLMRGLPFPRGGRLGDIYIDDLVLLSVVPFLEVRGGSVLHWLRRQARRREKIILPTMDRRNEEVNRVWLHYGMPQSEHKAVDGGARVDVWGGELWTLEGKLGFPRGRRASLMMATLLAVAGGASGRVLEQLVGGLTFALAFRREALSFLSASYGACRSLPKRRWCTVDGALGDELTACCFGLPLLEANLRSRLCGSVFATDASSTMGGACWAAVDEQTAGDIYAMCEEKGAHVRLSAGPGEQLAQELRDVRAAVAAAVAAVAPGPAPAPRSPATSSATPLMPCLHTQVKLLVLS
jgi:hypothetical protein